MGFDMKAVCVVAHPDDCLIFAYSLMYNFSKLDWHIVYLTYRLGDARADELAAYWASRNVPTKFLGFVDDYRDIEAGKCSFDTTAAQKAIEAEIQTADVVLAHALDGDYGHPHHGFVYDCVQTHPHVITFAPPDQGTHTYRISEPDYTAEQLPLHYDMIHSFHTEQHRNSYNMTPETYQRIRNA